MFHSTFCLCLFATNLLLTPLFAIPHASSFTKYMSCRLSSMHLDLLGESRMPALYEVLSILSLQGDHCDTFLEQYKQKHVQSSVKATQVPAYLCSKFGELLISETGSIFRDIQSKFEFNKTNKLAPSFVKTNLWTIYELILLQEPHHQQPTYLFNITSVFLTFSNDKNFFLNQAHEKHYVSCLDACKVEGVEILIRKKCPSFIAANIMNDTGLGYAYSGWALEEGEFDYLLKNHKPLGIEFNLIVAPEFQHNYTNLQWQRSIAAQILKV